MPFSRPIRSVTNCPSTTSDGRCGSDWTSAGRVRWPTAQKELAAFPTQHRRGGALKLGYAVILRQLLTDLRSLTPKICTEIDQYFFRTSLFTDINFTDFIFTDIIIQFYAIKASSVQVISVIIMSDNVLITGI